MTRFATPPVEYLRQCSNTSLRYFEMSKLEHAANLRRELTVLLDEMMEETALALLARWMLERRSKPAAHPAPPGEARGREKRATREMIAGWLAATQRVEACAPLSPAGGEALPAGESSNPSSAPQAALDVLDPAGAAGMNPPPDSARTERRTARKSGRAARSASQQPARNQCAARPKNDG